MPLSGWAHCWQVATLASYGALFLLLLLWHLWLLPPTLFPLSGILILYGVPLLVPFRGLWQGQRYTYQWVHFLTAWYFIHGVGALAADPPAHDLAIGEVFFSMLLYSFSLAYVRTTRLQ